jgi:hypothetical protein
MLLFPPNGKQRLGTVSNLSEPQGESIKPVQNEQYGNDDEYPSTIYSSRRQESAQPYLAVHQQAKGIDHKCESDCYIEQTRERRFMKSISPIPSSHCPERAREPAEWTWIACQIEKRTGPNGKEMKGNKTGHQQCHTRQ